MAAQACWSCPAQDTTGIACRPGPCHTGESPAGLVWARQLGQGPAQRGEAGGPAEVGGPLATVLSSGLSLRDEVIILIIREWQGGSPKAWAALVHVSLFGPAEPRS